MTVVKRYFGTFYEYTDAIHQDARWRKDPKFVSEEDYAALKADADEAYRRIDENYVAIGALEAELKQCLSFKSDELCKKLTEYIERAQPPEASLGSGG